MTTRREEERRWFRGGKGAPTTREEPGEHPPKAPQHRAQVLPLHSLSPFRPGPWLGYSREATTFWGDSPPAGVGTRAEIGTRDCPGGHPSWREGRSGAPLGDALSPLGDVTGKV